MDNVASWAPERAPSLPVGARGVREAAVAVAGLAILGAAAALGTGDPTMALRTLPGPLIVVVGAGVLTAPALVVSHQFARLQARPADLVVALGAAFARAGTVALGLAPAVVFFAVTSRLGIAAAALSVVVAGLFGFVAARRRLHEAERRSSSGAAGVMTMTALVVGWSALTSLIAGRIAWDVLSFVVGV